MKELTEGVYEFEDGDNLQALSAQVEVAAKEERARLNEQSGFAWYADVVFYVHDMIAYTGILRNNGDAHLADTIIEATTLTAKSLLKHVVADEAKASELWEQILHETQTLNAIMRKRLAEITGEKLIEH